MTDSSAITAWIAIGISTLTASYTVWSKTKEMRVKNQEIRAKEQEPIRAQQRQVRALMREAVHPLLRDTQKALTALARDDGTLSDDTPASFVFALEKLDKYIYVLTPPVKDAAAKLKDGLDRIDGPWHAFVEGDDIVVSPDTPELAANRKTLKDALDNIYDQSQECMLLTAEIDHS